jgi:hypothetical protein
MSLDPTPPRWAETLLRAFLRPRDVDCVSGDLLEEYRDSVYPRSGRRRADLWYGGQVLGFVARRAYAWAVVFAVAFIARTAMDWLLPTTDFRLRSTLSTVVGVGILLLAGFWAGLRSGSFAAGPLMGISIVAIAAPIKIAGTAALLAMSHGPSTIAAIRGSGGLAEVFTLPLMMIVPGVIFGAVGGFLGSAAKRLSSA